MFNNLFLHFYASSGSTTGSPAVTYGGLPSKNFTMTYAIDKLGDWRHSKYKIVSI